MHRWKVLITLKEGYKPVMALDPETELRFELEAKNHVTASRMVKALTANLANVEECAIWCEE